MNIVDNINNYTYSKFGHFRLFRESGIDIKLHGKTADPAVCDLKDYQDLLAFALLSQNLSGRMKVLEIGGGDSRIIKFFREEAEFWGLDKLEGIGNGPRETDQSGYKLVLDYIGNFSRELPDEYFDIVFSISALEHVPLGSSAVYENVLSDINRLLKPGGFTFHLIDHTTDLLLGEIDEAWTNPLIEYIFNAQHTMNKFVPLIEAETDPGLFCVGEEFYNSFWLPVTGKTYQEFGRPFSYNIFWKK